MTKVTKSFRFQYEFKDSRVVGTRLCTDRLPVTVEAMAYRKTCAIDNTPEYSVDVVQVFFEKDDITRVLCFFKQMDELSQAALELAPAQFREEETKRDTLQESLRYIAGVVSFLKGHSVLSLAVPIGIRINELVLFQVEGLQVSPKGNVYVLDGEGNANELTTSDVNASKMIAGIEAGLNRIYGKLERRPV